MKKAAVMLILCALVALFIYTGVSKLMERPVFEKTLHNQLALRPFSALLSWSIPIAEILIALLLVPDQTRIVALRAYLVLMAAFTLYIGLILTGILGHRPCSCGGVLSSMGWTMHFFFNLLTLLLTLVVYKIFMHEHRESRRPV